MASSNTPYLEAPEFSLIVQNQAKEWKLFYTRAADFPKALGIVPEKKDLTKEGWRQIKMMFEGEDCQAIQTLLYSNTITAEDQYIPIQTLSAIKTANKEEKYFWHDYDEVLCDL